MGSLFSDYLEAWDHNHITFEDYLDEHMESATADQLYIEHATVQALAEGYLERIPRHTREVQLGTRHYESLVFSGFIDGLYDDETLVENKLKSQWTANDQEALLLDDQVSCYVTHWALESGQSPEDITLQYHVTRKPALRQRKAELAHEFVERIKNDIVERPDHYYVEVPTVFTHRTNEQAEAYLLELGQVAKQIERSIAEDSWPKSTGNCLKYGSLCEMFRICSANADEVPGIVEQHYRSRASERSSESTDQEGRSRRTS
jgi:hypothetical protein